MRLIACRAADDARQLRRSCHGTSSHYGTGNAPRFRFITQLIDDIGNSFFGGTIDEIGGSFARLLHPHIKRAIGLKRKAPRGLIQLH